METDTAHYSFFDACCVIGRPDFPRKYETATGRPYIKGRNGP